MTLSAPRQADTPADIQYIARQAIFAPDKSVYAYELLYRNSTVNRFPAGVSDGQATGQLFYNALMLVGIERLTGGSRAFINLSCDALLSELPHLLTPGTAVIEVVERTGSLPQVCRKVAAMREQGYVFALDDYDGDAKWQALLQHVDFIKLELEEPLIKTAMRVRKMKRLYPNAKLIVERVESYEQFEHLKKAGADLFQGYFFARPEMMRFTNVQPAKAVVFELLACTLNKDIDFREVEQKVAKDLSLTARILKLANAKCANQSIVISSLNQAVVYLGEDSIRQFVRVLALSELGLDKPPELTRLGLVRAKLMELLLAPGGEDMAQQGYLVGLLSVLDAVLDISLETVVAEFSLDSQLCGALLSSAGMLGSALKLCKAMEQDQLALAEELLATIRPASPADVLFLSMYDARDYADETLSTLSKIDEKR